MYKYLSWPPPRPVITRQDDWQVYVIGSRVKVTRAELLRLFPDPERLDACIGRLRDIGRTDFVMYIQRHKPTFERYELPLKD